MTDGPDLTPEQDAVRRLLADARHDGPTPPEVVVRLDEVLASLASERQVAREDTTRAPVVDLGARRRRTAGIALLAAAAVVVAGVAIGQGLPRTSYSDSGGDSAASGESATSQDQDPGAQADGSGDDAGAADQAPESLKSTLPAPEGAYPTLSSDDVAPDDLLGLRSTVDPSAASEVESAQTLIACDLQGVGRGRRVAAQVDGLPGMVVFRRADGATQRVDLYVCGTPAPVRQLTLPAP